MPIPPQASPLHLRRFYFLRAVVAFIWVAIAFTVAHADQSISIALLATYAAWDALANYLDAQRTAQGANRLQVINITVSVLAALGIAAGWWGGFELSVAVFGAWAVLAGLLQLGVGIRRLRSGMKGQWVMILSGAQSALAGGFFASLAYHKPTGIADLAPYALMGGVYFLISALWLSWKGRSVG
jgi:hypothetical protein